MSLNGSGAGAAIFPMICCAKLAGIFENSKNKLKNTIFEKSFKKTLKWEHEIWIDLGRQWSD